MLLGDLLRRAAENDPDKAALIFPRERQTYGELEERSRHVANALRELGIGPGQRVGILYENSPAALVFFWGILRSGAQVVDLPAQAGAGVLGQILGESRPAALAVSKRQIARCAREGVGPLPGLVLTDVPETERAPLEGTSVRELAELLADAGDEMPAAEIDPRSPGIVIYTSGTTGLAKGVMLSHENLVSNLQASNSLMGLTSADSILVVVPFFFIHGRMQLLLHAMIGGTVAVSAGFQFPKQILAELNEHRVTGFSGVPYHFTTLMERTPLAETEFSHLRYVLITGGALPPTGLRQLADSLPGIDLHTAYGQTESSPRVTYLGPAEVLARQGCAGHALPGVTVEIHDEEGQPLGADEVGEVVVSGPNVMTGYVAGDEFSSGTLDDRHRLHTGDLGRLDEDGYLYLVGRRSEMIKTAGERVFPKELEAVLEGHADVVEAAVLGVPDASLGERIVAMAVVAEGTTPDPNQLRTWCLKSVPFVRAPKEVCIVPDLPKTASGKIDRGALPEAFRRITS